MTKYKYTHLKLKTYGYAFVQNIMVMTKSWKVALLIEFFIVGRFTQKQYKTLGQIFKQCSLDKYCSCDTACQISAL